LELKSILPEFQNEKPFFATANKKYFMFLGMTLLLILASVMIVTTVPKYPGKEIKEHYYGNDN